VATTLPETANQWHQRIWSLTWPIFLANVTIPLVGLVDTAIIGRLPDPKYLGAVALGSMILTALNWIFGFLRMGTTGLTAQALGRRDAAEQTASALRAGGLAVVIGVSLLAMQVPLHNLAFRLVAASVEVEKLASTYFYIRIWGTPALLLHLVNMGVLFGLQKMRATLLISVVLNVSNIALDALFVIAFEWGVSGVAIGTVVSEWLAASLGIAIVARSLPWRLASAPATLLDPRRLTDLFRVSGNLFVRSFFLQLPFMTLTAIGASLGNLVLAANAVLMQFFFLMAFALDSVAHSAETLAGFAFGGGDPEGLKRAARYSALWSGIMALVAGLAYWLFGDLLIGALTSLPDVQQAAQRYLPWAAILPVVAVWAFLLDGIFIGTTRTAELRNAMAGALCCYAGTLWLSLDALGNHGLWLAMTTFMASRGILLGAYYPRILKLANSAAAPQSPA
jgi:MATE family multidrug resistance protein